MQAPPPSASTLSPIKCTQHHSNSPQNQRQHRPPSPTLTPLQDLFCGAVAGTVARLVVAPLDVLKIRFQIQSHTHGLYRYTTMTSALRTIVATEGPLALWKGNIPALLMVTPYVSLQMATFYQLKQSQYISLPDPYASLVLGAVSASVATLFTYPLDLLRTRFAAQSEPKRYPTIRHALRAMYHQNGLRAFYAGLQPTLIEIIPYIATHFALYESLKRKYMTAFNTQQLQPYESMGIGALSGTTSKFLTLPLDNAKKLMQVEGQFDPSPSSTSRYRGIAHVLRSIWKRDGLRGWFRGIAPSLVKAAPNSAITFATYEACKRYFLLH